VPHSPTSRNKTYIHLWKPESRGAACPPTGAAHYNRLLPTDAQREPLAVVLVSPRNPLNIGAAARAMANFGFSRLAVVAPFAPSWREARSAVGAPELLQKASETATLAEAVADCTLVVGTASLAYRKPLQPVVALPHLAPLVAREWARGGRVALLFGGEKHGLERGDLSFCHLLAAIPTDPSQPSMNLGQSVAVCLYELAARAGASQDAEIAAVAERDRRSASSAALDRLAGLAEETMVAAQSSPASLREANRRDLRLLTRRLALSERDARRIMGIFRRILWRLKRDSAGKP